MTDILVHGMKVFGGRIDSLVVEIDELGGRRKLEEIAWFPEPPKQGALEKQLLAMREELKARAAGTARAAGGGEKQGAGGDGLLDRKEMAALMRPVTMGGLKIFATLCFLAALTVHLLSFGEADHSDVFAWAWLLHLGCFVGIFMMVAMMTKRGERQDKFWPRFLGTRRGLTRLAGILVIVYGVACLPLTIRKMGGKRPYEPAAGGFVLRGEGGEEEKVTWEVFRRYRAYEVRMFSAFWLIFFFFPMIYAWQADDLRYISETALKKLDEAADD